MKTNNKTFKGSVASITFDSCDVLETKEFNNEGKGMRRRKIKGYANKATIDRGGDLVLPTAFEKSMKQFMKNPLVFYNHDWDTPIGLVTSWKISDGLEVEVELATGDEDADKAWNRAQKGLLRSFSIGFMAKEADWDDEKGIRIIKDLELFEVSLVTIPMNAESMFEIDEKGVVKSVMFTQKEGQAMTFKQLHPDEDSVQNSESVESEKPNTTDSTVQVEKLLSNEELSKILPEHFNFLDTNCNVCDSKDLGIQIGTNVYSQPLYACKSCFESTIPGWTTTSDEIKFGPTQTTEDPRVKELQEAVDKLGIDLLGSQLSLEKANLKISSLEKTLADYELAFKKIEESLISNLSEEVKNLIISLIDKVKL